MRHCRTATAVAVIVMIAASYVEAKERSGLEIHAGIGPSVSRDRDDSGTFEGNGFGYTFGLEYRFMPRFALGLDLFELGSASDTVGTVDTEIKAAGIDLSARLIFALSDRVEVCCMTPK